MYHALVVFILSYIYVNNFLSVDNGGVLSWDTENQVHESVKEGYMWWLYSAGDRFLLGNTGTGSFGLEQIEINQCVQIKGKHV